MRQGKRSGNTFTEWYNMNNQEIYNSIGFHVMCQVSGQIMNIVGKQVVNQVNDDTLDFIYTQMLNVLGNQISGQVKGFLNEQ